MQSDSSKRSFHALMIYLDGHALLMAEMLPLVCFLPISKYLHWTKSKNVGASKPLGPSYPGFIAMHFSTYT